MPAYRVEIIREQDVDAKAEELGMQDEFAEVALSYVEAKEFEFNTMRKAISCCRRLGRGDVFGCPRIDEIEHTGPSWERREEIVASWYCDPSTGKLETI